MLTKWQTAWQKLPKDKRRLITIGCFVVVVALIGSIIIKSHAATFTTGMEAESGSVSGNAESVNSSSSGASGNSAVIFGRQVLTPPPPPTGGASCGTVSGSGATIAVSSASAFSSALASAKGGDTLVLSGSFTSGISVSGKSYSGSPLIIKSASPLGTTLNSLQITGSNNIVVQGFNFGPNTASTYIKIAESTNIKVLRNVFDGKGITVGQTAVITSGNSQYIDIGCNEFRDKYMGFESATKVTGSFIKTQFDAPSTMTKNLHVYRNYFHNIAPFLVNGVPAGDSDREAIAMGIADSQSIVTNNVVEYNLFEDCDGENEIITVKTSHNTFNNNTFKNSMGSLSFRLGSGSTAENNYFYGTGASATTSDPNYQTGGIRVYGTNHMLRNNFMKDLTGISYRLPILLDSGDTSNSVGGDSHQVPSGVQVTGNTIVNSAGGIHIGSANYKLLPSGNTVSNNTVSGSLGILFNDLGSSNTWSGNKAYATGSAAATGGATRSASEVQILSSAPSVTPPGALAPGNVGTNAP